LFTGPHDYSVRQIDAAGNTGTETTVSWVVDYTVPAAPTVTRTQPATSPTNSPSQAISYSGEAGATFQCKLDSAPTGPCPASPVNLTGQLEGPHTYAVTQTDAAGNLSVAGSVTWTIDTTAPWAPTVTRTFPSETPTTSTSQTISYGGFEAGGSFACKLDDAEFGPCQASPITFTNLSDGQHTASFTHTDAAGNVSPPKPITWTVDVLAPEPPILTRVAPTINPTSSTSQTISYSGEPGGTYECKIDDAPFAACPSSPVTVTGLGLGSHTYTVRQTDGFGHVGSAGTIAWTVTNVPDPVVPTGATGSEGIVDPPITAKLSAVSPKAIVAARTGSPFFVGSKRSAASFTVTLSKAATVRLRLELLVSGKTSRASTAWTELKLKSGRTTIRLSGRSAKRALAAGRYRVHLKVAGTSTDVLGKTFQIKR
jgi:hypothetical protein